MPVVDCTFGMKDKIDMPMTENPSREKDRIDMPEVQNMLEQDEKIDMPVVESYSRHRDVINMPEVENILEQDDKLDMPVTESPSIMKYRTDITVIESHSRLGDRTDMRKEESIIGQDEKIDMPVTESPSIMQVRIDMSVIESPSREEANNKKQLLESFHRQEVKLKMYPDLNNSNVFVNTKENSKSEIFILNPCEDQVQNASTAVDGNQNITNRTFYKQNDDVSRHSSNGKHKDDNSDDSSSSCDNSKSNGTSLTDDNDNEDKIAQLAGKITPLSDNRHCQEPTSEPYDIIKHSANAAGSDLLQMSEEGILRAATSMSGVMAIGLSTLDQLKSLNKSDPAIKRLLYSPKITAKEVRNTPIDADIKTMVSDFLKTNVVGNFIISRVLRENYATFYGWLATHLQCERNAWAERLKQTLEISETIRREKLNLKYVVIDTANRLDTLVQDCSTSIHPTLPPITNTRPQYSLGIRHDIPSTLYDSNKELITGGSSSKRDNSRLEKIDNLHSNTWDTYGDLLGSSTLPISLEQKTSSTCTCKKARKSDTESGKCLLKESLTPKTTVEPTWEDNVCHVRAALDEGTDMNVDWETLLTTRTRQLEYLCQALITERCTCLQMLGVKPHHCYSLVEALASYTSERHNVEVMKRREIEKTLGLLELENSQLIKEMSGLQTILLEKQHDALNLQKQLDRLEAVITSASSPKFNKAVGTNDGLVTKHRLGKLSTSLGKLDIYNSKCFRSNGDVRGSIHRVVKTVNDLLPNNKNTPPDPGAEILLSKMCESRSNELSKTSLHEETERSVTPYENLKNVRERSLIAISGEKLSSLKHRARQLEESLHDAISSLVISHQPQTTQITDTVHSEPCGQHLNRQGRLKCATPKPAVVKRPTSHRRSRSETILETEATSLLSGRSVTLAPNKTTDRCNVQDCLNARKAEEKTTYKNEEKTTYKNNQAEPLTLVSQHGPIQSQSINRTLTDGQNPEVSAKTFFARHARVISRLRSTGNMVVSKCLRCQKLFNAGDNHKMACFYHIKDKENVKHYDQSGKLTRVLVLWACCHQSQDIEGCCYGKHV